MSLYEILRHPIQVGLSFGLTSGVITTLGLVVGLAAGTRSRLAVIGGILTIAVADGLSDALGIHISEEAENVHSAAEIWTSTAVTFGAKFLIALSFLPPVLLLDLRTAVIGSLLWGGLILLVLSLFVARQRRVRALPVVLEHLGVAAVVVVATHLLGLAVGRLFR